MTKDKFKVYVMDCKGYDEIQVKEIFQQMRDFGTSIQDYLTSEELAKFENYNK